MLLARIGWLDVCMKLEVAKRLKGDAKLVSMKRRAPEAQSVRTHALGLDVVQMFVWVYMVIYHPYT